MTIRLIPAICESCLGRAFLIEVNGRITGDALCPKCNDLIIELEMEING